MSQFNQSLIDRQTFGGGSVMQFTGAQSVPDRFGAPSAANTRRGAGKVSGVHTVRQVQVPKLKPKDIYGVATELTNIQKFRGGDEDFTTVARVLDGVYSGYGRDMKSQLTDYDRVYMTPALANALQAINNMGGDFGVPGANFVGQDYGDVKITVGPDGLLVPGSAMQKRALQNNDLVGTITMDNPIPNDKGRFGHGVTLGSPTYWKIYAKLDGREKVEWHNRLFDLGLAQAASDAGLLRDRPVNSYADLPKESKHFLRQGYDEAKNPEKVRLGSIAAVAQLLSTVHMLENEKSRALPPSKWGTAEGKAHAQKMAAEIIKGVDDYRTKDPVGKKLFDETGFLQYVPTNEDNAVRYSKYARGKTEDGRNKAAQRSLSNPMTIAYDDKGKQVGLYTRGGKSGALSKSKTKPASVHPAMFSGPGITTRGEFRNTVRRPNLATGGYSTHARAGKQYAIKDRIQSAYVDKDMPTGTTQVVRRDGKTYSVPSSRGRSTRNIPKPAQDRLKARGFSGDSVGFYANAAGFDLATQQYAPMAAHGGKTWAEMAEKQRARDIKLGNYTDPKTVDWQAYAAAGGNLPHPYAKPPKHPRKQR